MCWGWIIVCVLYWTLKTKCFLRQVEKAWDYSESLRDGWMEFILNQNDYNIIEFYIWIRFYCNGYIL